MNRNSDIQDDTESLLKRLIIIFSDIQIAQSAITFLNSEVVDSQKYGVDDLRRFKCYETTFIVSYVRPFTKSEGSKYNSLSLKRIGVLLTSDQKAVHDYFITLRNKIFAHSDEAFSHVRLDFHDIKLDDVELLLPHIQFEEGLSLFTTSFRSFGIELSSIISAGIFKTIQRIGAEKSRQPVYLTRSKFE